MNVAAAMPPATAQAEFLRNDTEALNRVSRIDEIDGDRPVHIAEPNKCDACDGILSAIPAFIV